MPPQFATFSEKSDVEVFAVEGQRSRRKYTRAVLRILAAIGCLALVVLRLFGGKWFGSSLLSEVRAVPDAGAFNWTSIAPSKKLKWTPCHGEYECTRLQVPLDYNDQKAGEAAIAIVRYASVIPHDDEGYMGPVLFNPGGPGGSGIEFLLGRAKQLRTILGDGYDLVSFDPRGIGFTTPTLATLQSKGEEGLFTTNFLTSVNASDAALGSMYATAQNLGQIAAARMGDVAQYVSTPTVARDMLSITKAHGRDKLQYWGFSYGTVLGATFAAMFPDNVGRVIIDGVVDAENYYASLWSNNLIDTDAGLFHVYQACVDAGPLVCRIHESTADKIHARIQKLLNTLKVRPISFYNAESGAYGIVDYATTQKTIFRTLYNPHTKGKNLTSALADLEEGNAQPLFEMSEIKAAQALVTDACACPGSPREAWSDGGENTLAVACGDGDVVTDDVDTLREYYEKMTELSMFAEVWWLRIGCSGWKVRAKERFSASFETNTSFPLLVIGNTADPVTPLWAARKMSRGFKNSVVLHQDSPGHCSLAATSLCTAKVIRAYFQNGTLPKEGTVCDVQSSVFGDDKLRISGAGLVADDMKLLQASYELQQNPFVPML